MKNSRKRGNEALKDVKLRENFLDMMRLKVRSLNKVLRMFFNAISKYILKENFRTTFMDVGLIQQ